MQPILVVIVVACAAGSENVSSTLIPIMILFFLIFTDVWLDPLQNINIMLGTES